MVHNIIIGRNEADMKKLGMKGLLFIGKNYVKMGQTTSLSSNIYLDVNNAHVILVSGKRGSGKCLTGDSLITLGDGSVKELKELVNDNNQILALNNELKVSKTAKTEFFEREVNELYYVKLRSGREIKLTPEHPLLTIKGWKPAYELGLGVRVAVPRKLVVFGDKEIEDFKIKLLAYFIAEGHTKNTWVLFSNSDRAILDEFNSLIKIFDNNLRVEQHSKAGCYRVCQINKLRDIERMKRDKLIRYQTHPIKKWLQDYRVYNLLAPKKFIPPEILKLKEDLLALFLNRLFSCDGSIYKNRKGNSKYWEISYSSSSKKLIYQVQHLLLRFGILSKLRKKRTKNKGIIFSSYEIVINEATIPRFIEKIGFFGEKRKKQEKCINGLNNSNKIRNPNVDTIPKEVWELYKPKNWAKIGRYFGYKYPKAMRERLFYSCSRQTLLKVAEAEQSNPLMLLANSDIFWDEIVLMEKLEGKFKVYDISVPELHNFVADDIFVHNSYCLSVMAEEITRLHDEVKKNLAVLILDTMGIFWSMKYPNLKQEDELKIYNLKPQGLDVKVYTPKGKFNEYKKKNIPTDFNFSIKPSELDAGDWCNVFNIELMDDKGVLVERVIGSLKGDYDIEDIIKEISKDKKSTTNIKNAVENRFRAAKVWGLFDKEGTKIKDIIRPGEVSILDVSCYTDWNIKCLVIGILGKKLLQERIDIRKLEEMESIEEGQHYFDIEKKKREMPMVWILIDEGHEFLPREGKTAASDALIQILREGRQPGISLVLATQQPGEIARDVMTQSDIVISFRVTAKLDIEALNSIMQTYLTGDILSYLNNLPRIRGSAIILDDNSERIYPFKTRPKLSWHGGDAPSAVRVKKNILDLGI